MGSWRGWSWIFRHAWDSFFPFLFMMLEIPTSDFPVENCLSCDNSGEIHCACKNTMEMVWCAVVGRLHFRGYPFHYCMFFLSICHSNKAWHLFGCKWCDFIHHSTRNWFLSWFSCLTLSLQVVSQYIRYMQRVHLTLPCLSWMPLVD